MALIGLSYGGDAITRWLDTQPAAIGCVEVAAEDFYKLSRHYLASLATRYPLIVRAASLSVGTPGALHGERLGRLAEVVAIANPLYVVHPLGFSQTDEINLGRSLPISLNAPSLAVVAEHVLQLIQACGKPILVQNITAPLRVPGTMAETDFLNRLCEEAGCRLLVDVTSLLVASRNHRFDPLSWLRDLDGGRVGGAQIGGCCLRDGRWRGVDQCPFDEEAWSLIRALVQRARPDVILIQVQGASGGIGRLERDIERLRLVASIGVESNVGCQVPAPSVGPQPVRSKSRPRRSPPKTRASEIGEPADAWSGHIDIAADTSLYVLDREGVFFSESRQEVYLFNTAATLIWCLAEQGLPVNGVIDAYRRALGVSLSEATTHVAAMLQQWFGLGYIHDPALPAAPEIPLTTALARLLTNPQLRSQFRASAQKTAKALRIEAADFHSFVTLEPDELDKQAEEIAELRSGWRYRGAAGRTTPREATTVAVDPDLIETALRARMRQHPSSPWRNSIVAPRTARRPAGKARRPRISGIFEEGVTQPAGMHRRSNADGVAPRAARSGRSHCYRLLTTVFRVDLPSDSLGSDLQAALAHLQVVTQTPDVVLTIGDVDGSWIVFDGATPVKHCGSTNEIVPTLKQMLREISVNRYRFLIKIHAGVILFGSGCLLLPGAAGSGKTTLTAALLRSGGKYFSDEVALLEEDTLGVRPVPLALTIKAGSVEPLRALYPELSALTQHLREDHQDVRYLPPPHDSLFDDGQAHQVRWIVFPRYDPTVEPALIPLDRSTGLKRLLDESLVLPELLDRDKVHAMVGWMRNLQCFELPLSSLDSGIALVRSLTA